MSAPAREGSSGDTQQQSQRTQERQHSTATRNASELVTEHGKTTIAEGVVAKIVGMAAREVPGVYEMGAGFSRAMGAMKERLPGGAGGGPNLMQGVAVEVGERQTAIDLDVVADYGVSIPDLANGVRRNVIAAVDKMCGLEVTEVNINVGDIHLPGEEGSDQESSQQSRVQ